MQKILTGLLLALIVLSGCAKRKKKNPFLLLPVLALNSGGSTYGLPKPKLEPDPGKYDNPVEVKILSELSDADIYFSLDGSEPTSNSYKYEKPIHIWKIAGMKIKAILIKGNVKSEITEGIYSYPPLKTGQTVIDMTGDDGYHQKGVNRGYDVHTTLENYSQDYVTVDKSTGLVWRPCLIGQSGSNCQNGSASGLNWSQAQGHSGCHNLDHANNDKGYAGLQNWRVPTIKEAMSINRYNISFQSWPFNPTIDPNGFPHLPGGTASFWLKESIYADNLKAYHFSISGGALLFDGKNHNHQNALCVSSETLSGKRILEDKGDGTILDYTTGLLWQKCSKGQIGSSCGGTAFQEKWSDAVTYCNNLNLAGKQWRLPNKNELASLISQDVENQTPPFIVDKDLFPNTPAGEFASSTTNASSSTTFWSINFANSSPTMVSSSFNNLKSNNQYYVRCVTDGI